MRFAFDWSEVSPSANSFEHVSYIFVRVGLRSSDIAHDLHKNGIVSPIERLGLSEYCAELFQRFLDGFFFRRHFPAPQPQLI